MKIPKSFLGALFAGLLVFSSNAPAAPFSPKTLKITGPSAFFQRGRGPIDLPITVSGTDANLILAVFTNNQASRIQGINNGYLGWHYMNNIDTCLYISPPQALAPGKHTIHWNGREGLRSNMDYYLWAYDHVSPPQPAARHIPLNRGFGSFVTRDTDGTPLARPLFIPTVDHINVSLTPSPITRYRWALGNDPNDAVFVETTRYSGWSDTGALALNPENLNEFFVVTDRPDNRMLLYKYAWTPNGEAVKQTNWGEDGASSLYAVSPAAAWRNPGVITDGEDYLFFVCSQNDPADPKSWLVWFDIMYGVELRRQDLSEWWTGPSPDGNGNTVYGPTVFTYRNRRIALASHASCLHMLLDPYVEDERDLAVYVNGSGDGIGDKISGICNDPDAAPFAWSTALDSGLFTVFPADGFDHTSFGLIAPDGTGAGYFAIGNPVIPIRGAGIVECGSAYDGLYMDCGPGEYSGLRYVAWDIFKGHIAYSEEELIEIHFRRTWDYPHENRANVIFSNPPEINGEPLTNLDQIAVFSSDGKCVGTMFWGMTPLYIFGDDPYTPEIDGILEGEAFSFRIWEKKTRREFPAVAEFETGEAVYHSGSTYTVASLRADESVGVAVASPERFALLQNTPNPFNPSTTLSFTLPRAEQISLTVYDITGRRVAEIARGFYPAGMHSTVWDARECASGVYFCTLRAGKAVETRKILLAR